MNYDKFYTWWATLHFYLAAVHFLDSCDVSSTHLSALSNHGLHWRIFSGDSVFTIWGEKVSSIMHNADIVTISYNIYSENVVFNKYLLVILLCSAKVKEIRAGSFLKVSSGSRKNISKVNCDKRITIRSRLKMIES